jgi:5'-3' exonuclease
MNRMCILSGCDYLDNLPGIGLGKAKKALKAIKKNEIDEASRLFLPLIIKINENLIKFQSLGAQTNTKSLENVQIANQP